MPPNDSPRSKLVNALQQRENNSNSGDSPAVRRLSVGSLPVSRSTPFQQHRRKTSFGVNPTPTRNPSMTLQQRRRTAASGAGLLNSNNKPVSDVRLLPRLEEENANLPPQDSIEFIMAQIERQNAMLDEDPKSVCIQSNELKAHLSTMQNLVSDQSSEDEIDWEFWTALTEDFSAVAVKLPHLLSAKLRAGIPAKVRGVIWQAMSQSASLNLETMYGQLIAEHSPYDRIIQRDLARTFPHVDMFKQEGGDGQQALERVLKAYSLYDAHVGYCQGLAFLVGPLLMNMPEQQAFCVFVRLMETYEMRTMFTLNMEGLQLRLYQFTSLLSQILPELSEHLSSHGVHAPMYASQWFLTLFAYAFPIHLVLRIYDIVFAEGAAETIVRVAIAMMKRSQEQLMQMNEFEDILDHLTSKLHLEYEDDASLMINDAMALSALITRDKMDQLADLYVREMEEEQKQTEQVMAVRFNFWSKQSDKNKKKRDSGGWLNKRSSSSSSSSGDESSKEHHVSQQQPSNQQQQQSHSPNSQAANDVATLHQQIEDLLLAFSQIQKENIQLQQELMQVRMDKMDVEAERDALKLTMYDMQQQQQQQPTVNTGRMRSELEKLRNDNRELQQQIEELRHENEMAKEAQNGLIEKIVDMKNKMEQMEREKLEMSREREALVRNQKNAEAEIRELKARAWPPRRSNTTGNRRPVSVMLSSSSSISEEPSEARCLELEQMLADAKLRIAELETFGQSPPTSVTVERNSKRKSCDPSSLSKRSSLYGRLWSTVISSQDTPPTSPV